MTDLDKSLRVLLVLANRYPFWLCFETVDDLHRFTEFVQLYQLTLGKRMLSHSGYMVYWLQTPNSPALSAEAIDRQDCLTQLDDNLLNEMLNLIKQHQPCTISHSSNLEGITFSFTTTALADSSVTK